MLSDDRGEPIGRACWLGALLLLLVGVVGVFVVGDIITMAVGGKKRLLETRETFVGVCFGETFREKRQ